MNDGQQKEEKAEVKKRKPSLRYVYWTDEEGERHTCEGERRLQQAGRVYWNEESY